MNKKLIEKYKQFMDLSVGKESHQPDTFLRDIHNEYINNGKTTIGMPLYLTWYITDVCNLRCFFCSAKALCGKEPVKYENTLKIAQKIVDSGCLYVSFMGGEPTLCADLLPVIRMFNKNHIFTEIVSNGFGINENFVSELLKLNVDLIRFKLSLDSCTKNINDSIRGPGSFESVIRALDCLCNKNIDTRLQMVVTESNKLQIYDMYKLAESKGCKSFGFSVVMPIGRGVQLPTFHIDEDILNQLIRIRKEEKNTRLQQYNLGIDTYNYMQQIYGTKNVPEMDGNRLSIIKCNGCRYRLCLSKDGDVFPCDMTRFDQFKLGNILDKSLIKLIKSKGAKTFNQITRQTKEHCKDCKYKWCNSGCFGICYENTKCTGQNKPMCEL